MGKLPDGDYSVKAQAFNAQGNVGQCNSVSLVVDRIPPTIGGNIVALGPQVIYPLSDGTIPSVAGVKMSFVVSIRGGITKATIKTNQQEFPLSHLSGTDLWEGLVGLNQKGSSPLTVVAQDGAGHTDIRIINTYSAQDYGSISDSATNKPIKDATVTLYIFNDAINSWVVWDGASYGQSNPQITNSNGQYSFLVPQGKYYLDIEKSGYQTALSKITDLTQNTVLNTPIKLIPYSQLGLSLGYVVPNTYSIEVGQSPALRSQNSLKVGEEMQSFSFSQMDGTAFTNKNLEGKKYVLVFFAPWSAPSIEGISQASGISQKSLGQAKVIGVSVQESASATKDFLTRGRYNLFAVADYDGSYSAAMGVSTLPYYVFVGSNGKVSEIFDGVLTQEELLKKLVNMP